MGDEMSEEVECCDVSGLTCKAMLCKMLEAYVRITTGGGVIEVQFGDDRTKYESANVKMLETRLRTLHEACGDANSAALLGLSVGRRAPARVCFGESYGCGSSSGGCH